MTVADLIAALERLDQDTLVLRGEYDTYAGGYRYLRRPDTYEPQTIFVKHLTGENYADVTDKERDADIPAIVL